MSSDLAFQPMPQPWSIFEATGPDGAPLRILRIGAREVAVADIESVAVEDVSSRDHSGLQVMALLFGTASLVLLLGVVEFSWRPRFLIGFAFLGALALASVWDIVGLRPIVYRRLHIRTRRGASLLFASADPRQAAELGAALGLDLPGHFGSVVHAPDGRGKNRATGALQVE